MARFISISTLSIALVTCFAGAVPTEVDFSKLPEVIPGPGMPTLESLGLTSADLWKQVITSESHGIKSTTLVARDTYPACGDFAMCSDRAAAVCNTYLNSVGTTNCEIKNQKSMFCGAGDCKIWGYAQTGVSAVATCSNVAAATTWVLDNCSVRSKTQGAAFARGSNNLLVTVGQ